jgi:hypothetical protein
MKSIRIGEKKPSKKEKEVAFRLFSMFIYIQNYLDLNENETATSMLNNLKVSMFNEPNATSHYDDAKHILIYMNSKDYNILSDTGHHSKKLIKSIMFKKRCPSGSQRNSNGRCIKIKTKKPCLEGKVRNPSTGRCIKIKTKKIIKPCLEGKVRNPSTGRCIKIKTKKQKILRRK